jgi:hypothetical protein
LQRKLEMKMAQQKRYKEAFMKEWILKQEQVNAEFWEERRKKKMRRKMKMKKT